MNITNITIDTNATEEVFQASLKTKIVILSIFGLVLLTGIVGNIVVLLLIALEKSMHTTVNRCLFVLAVADLLILVFLPVIPIGHEFLEDSSFLGITMCYFLICYDRGAVVCSILIFCFLSIDRYFAICHPLKNRRFWSGRNTYAILLIILLLAIGSSVPYLYIAEYKASSDGNVTSYSCDYNHDASWKLNYDRTMTGAICFIPIPMLVYLYGRMIFELRKTVISDSKGVGASTSGHRGRLQVMIMLLSVVIIFIVCQTPFSVLLILEMFIPNIYDYNAETVYFVVWVSRILIYVNSAANPVVYFTVSSKFRHAFVNVFCCRKKLRKGTINSGTRLSTLNRLSSE